VVGFSRQLFWGIPLTTKVKRGKYYFGFVINGKREVSVAILSQLRAYDSARISGVARMGRIDSEVLLEIKNKLREFL